MPAESLGYALLSTNALVDTIDQVIPSWSGLDENEVVLRVITRDGKPVSVEIIEL